MLRRLLFIAFAGALLTACGSGQDTGAPAATEAGGQHNDADAAFARGMIPHHKQAIEMAKLVEGRTDGPELRTLAGNIVMAQGEEITLLEGCQRALGQRPAPAWGTGPWAKASRCPEACRGRRWTSSRT